MRSTSPQFCRNLTTSSRLSFCQFKARLKLLYCNSISGCPWISSCCHKTSKQFSACFIMGTLLLAICQTSIWTAFSAPTWRPKRTNKQHATRSCSLFRTRWLKHSPCSQSTAISLTLTKSTARQQPLWLQTSSFLASIASTWLRSAVWLWLALSGSWFTDRACSSQKNSH